MIIELLLFLFYIYNPLFNLVLFKNQGQRTVRNSVVSLYYIKTVRIEIFPFEWTSIRKMNFINIILI